MLCHSGKHASIDDAYECAKLTRYIIEPVEKGGNGRWQ